MPAFRARRHAGARNGSGGEKLNLSKSGPSCLGERTSWRGATLPIGQHPKRPPYPIASQRTRDLCRNMSEGCSERKHMIGSQAAPRWGFASIIRQFRRAAAQDEAHAAKCLLPPHDAAGEGFGMFVER